MLTEFTYFRDGELDRMAGLVWQLAQELYVSRQRLLALEQLLVESGHLPADALDHHRPTGEAQVRMDADGAAFVARLIRTISETDDHHSPMRAQFEQQLSQVR